MSRKKPNIDSLADEISADLAPSDFPSDLGVLAEIDLLALHARVVGEARNLQDKIKRDGRPSGVDKDLDRLRAILKLKYKKTAIVEKEIGTRDHLLPSDANLRALSYTELHALRTRVNDDLRDGRIRLQDIERMDTRAPARLAELKRLHASLKCRKSEYDRLSLEFKRRKISNLDLDRFLVRVASADPAELERYLNDTRDRNSGWWPQSVIGMGDHVLVVWKTKEPLREGDSAGDESKNE